MKVSVQHILGSNLAIFDSDGIAVFKEVNKHISNGENVVIDFSGIKRCTTHFTSSCIGKLLVIHGVDKIVSMVSYEFDANSELIQKRLNEIVDHAKNKILDK